MITFTDQMFILAILPLFLLLYYIVPAKYRAWPLFIFSAGFYCYNDYRYLGLLTGLIIINYLVGLLVKKEKKIPFVFIIFLNIGTLISFKALGFMDKSILIPLGLSYYIFKLISYQADLFKGKIQKHTIFGLATYAFIFTQIISGPIARYSYIEAGFATPLENKNFKTRVYETLYQIQDGLKLFIIGLFMKICLADNLAILWSNIKTIGYESISTPLAWTGVYTYSLRLYYDFWGYSLMAAGIGIMLGFPFIKNFDQPYSSRTVAEFYRRWHMTLGEWFRDYIYFPLGGSRKGQLRTIINLLVVWLITGLWHGLTPNFMIWSGSLFIMILMEKFVFSKNDKLLAVIGRFHVWFMIPLTWGVFAITSIKNLGLYFARLFPLFGVGIAVNHRDIVYTVPKFAIYLIPAIIMLLPIWEKLYKKYKDTIIVQLLLLLMAIASMYFVINSGGNPFMYLRF